MDDARKKVSPKSSSSSWGQFDSFRTNPAPTFADGSMGMDEDEESRLFELGVSVPSQDCSQDVKEMHHSQQIQHDLDSPMDLGGGHGSDGTSSASTSLEKMPDACMKCSAQDMGLVYSYPCGCYSVCRKCAMKLATGGKCKTCKQFYTSFTSTHTPKSNPSTDSDDEGDANNNNNNK